MGEAGKFTRLLCLKLGAPYTYVSAGASNATASGQYTREEMERLLSAENYPSRDFASSVGRRLPFLVPRAWLSGPCWLLRWLRERAGSPITPLATI